MAAHLHHTQPRGDAGTVRTLRAVAAGGPDAFYKGQIARLIADSMTQNGGLITLEQFEKAEHPPERLWHGPHFIPGGSCPVLRLPFST